MSTRDNNGLRRIRRNHRKSKKAVSIIVGYVLLIVFAVVLGAIVYKWMKTYVPHEDFNCPEGTSLSIEDYNYSGGILSLSIKNNGNFNVGGYFIYASDSPNREFANLNISQMNMDSNAIIENGSIVIFGTIGEEDKNSLAPKESEIDEYDLTTISGGIYSIEIIPIRWETRNRIINLISCKDAIISEKISEN